MRFHQPLDCPRFQQRNLGF
ncbi:unnamed protein product [Victoria cruziana]